MSNFSSSSTPPGSGETATIGASIFVKGRIEGNDDLVIRGRVEGTVTLPKNRVIVASGSEVKADVTARSIQVEGHVQGTLKGGHDVIVRAGGRVEGDIQAPRVSLDNGAQFNGTIDMGKDAPAKTGQKASSAT